MSNPLVSLFAEWSATLSVANVPAEVHLQARRAILDLIGVMLAGAVHPTSAVTRAATVGASGICTAVGGTRSSAPAAALINGTAAHAWDFDDTSYTGIMHGSAVILPAVLAAAEEKGSSDEDVLAAFIAGSEIAYTLGEIVSHEHYFKGWWSTATLGLIGATAGAARAYKLDASSTPHAIALAPAGAGTTKCLFGTDGKAFFVGESARRAIEFAKAAAAGLKGPIDAFEHPRGFFSLLNGGMSRIEAAETLGERWRLEDPGLLFKLSPVCSAAHAVIEATSRLMAASGAAIEQINGIHCQVPDLVRISLVFDLPKSPQEAQFSLPYAVACAALHSKVRLEDLDPSEVTSVAKRSIMDKVMHESAPDLSSDRMRSRHPESARVALTFVSGERYEEFCADAYGMPANPLSHDDLWEKLLACAAFAGVATEKLSAASSLLSDASNRSVPIMHIARTVLA